MRADDRQLGKVAMQTLHFRQTPVLDIEHHGFGLGPFDFVPQFLAGASHIYGEMRVKSADQRPGHMRILLQNNYILCHTSPDLYRRQQWWLLTLD